MRDDTTPQDDEPQDVQDTAMPDVQDDTAMQDTDAQDVEEETKRLRRESARRRQEAQDAEAAVEDMRNRLAAAQRRTAIHQIKQAHRNITDAFLEECAPKDLDADMLKAWADRIAPHILDKKVDMTPPAPDTNAPTGMSALTRAALDAQRNHGGRYVGNRHQNNQVHKAVGKITKGH